MESRAEERYASCLTTLKLFRVHHLISSDWQTDYLDFENFVDLWKDGFDRDDVCNRGTLESWLDYMESNGGVDNWKNTHPCFLLDNLTLAAYLMKSQFTNLAFKLANDIRFSTADVNKILDDLNITDDPWKKYSNAILSISRKPITEEIVNNIFEPYKIRFMREGENNCNVVEPAEPTLDDIKEKLKKLLDEAEDDEEDEEESFLSDGESEEYRKIQEVVLTFSKEKPDNKSDMRKSLLNIIASSTRLLALLEDIPNQEATGCRKIIDEAKQRCETYENERSLTFEDEIVAKEREGHVTPQINNKLIPRVIIHRIDARKLSREEPRDTSLHENDDHGIIDMTSDTTSSQCIQFLQKNPNQTIVKKEETYNTQSNNEIKIEFECENFNSSINSLVPQNLDINIGCHPNGQNEKIVPLQSTADSEKSDIRKTRSRKLGRYRNRHKCYICGKTFASKCSLDRHLESLHYGITHACGICGKTYPRKDHVKKHVDSVHNGQKPNNCDKCGKTFIFKIDLEKHIDLVHNITYPCYICGKLFKRKRNLQIHIDLMHTSNIKLHKHEKGTKSFNYKDNRTSHINMAQQGSSYSCDLCRKVFTTSTTLKRHKDSAHDNITHSCDVCDKTFVRKENLKIHINSIHKGITHTCDQCGKSFARRYRLTFHVNAVHNGKN